MLGIMQVMQYGTKIELLETTTSDYVERLHCSRCNVSQKSTLRKTVRIETMCKLTKEETCMYSHKIMFGIGVIAVVFTMSACQKNDAPKKASQSQPAVSPLVDFRQKISMKSSLTAMKPGKVATATVTITNTGDEDWPAGGASPVNLSYHWIDRSQQVVVFRR